MTISDPRQPTLADIAARAGTTVPTVSKVLNGRSDVSEQTRRKIMELVAETGYRRRTTSARSADQRLVDLVIGTVAGGWANQVLVGVERAAAEAGLDLVVTAAHRGERLGGRNAATGSDGKDWVTRLLARSSAGVVLAIVQPTAEQRALLSAAGVPVVLLDPSNRPPDDLASVGATNWPAGGDVAEHLLGLGHRRFGVLAWRADQLYSRARVDGFVSTITSALGDRAAIDTVYVDRNTPSRAAAQLLDSGVAPTAIFACADALALAVLEEATARGIAVPEQLSLVGFDDLPEAHWVGLTTVRQPIAEMGSAALRLLLRLRDSDRRLPREELATTLVVRTTTGPVDPSAT